MKTSSPSATASRRWLVPTGLLLLSAIPLIFGGVRLHQLAMGAEITPANARFFAAPAPVVVHILSSAAFAVLGAFQFVTGDRRRWLAWHRAAGRVSLITGLLSGLSGIWMTLFYPHTDALLMGFRLAAGSGMVLSIGLGLTTIRRRDVLGHQAWMMRAYALGMGAGTQVLTGIVESLIVAHPDALSKAVSMGAAWLINLIVAEWIIRRRSSRQTRVAAGQSVATR